MALRTILSSILLYCFGPLLIYYFMLLAPVVFQVAFKEPGPLEVPQWPSTTKAEDKAAIISARKPIIKDLMDFLGGKNAEFFKQHATEDIDWEDGMSRFTGFDDVDGFARLTTRMVKDTNIEIFGEHHAPHEIIMDWKLRVILKWLPSLPITIGMRTHILLEPSTVKVGAPEKVFRVFEEWGGHPLLNEKSFSPAMIGKFCSNLRKSHGYMMTQGIKYGIL